MLRKTLDNIITNLVMLDHILNTVAIFCLALERFFFLSLFSEPLHGTPCDRFWLPPGPLLERIWSLSWQPWSDVPYFLDEFGNTFGSNGNDFVTRFAYFVNTGRTQKLQNIKTKSQNNKLHINPQKYLFPFYVWQQSVSSKLDFCLSRVSGTPKGITIPHCIHPSWLCAWRG